MSTESESGDAKQYNREFQTGPVLGSVRVIDSDQAESSPQGLPPGPVPSDARVTVVADEENAEKSQTVGYTPPVVSMTSIDRKLLGLGLTVLAILALTFAVSHAVAEFARLRSLSPIIGGLYLAALAIVGLCVLIVAARSLRRYQRLREVAQLRQAVEQYERGKVRHPRESQRLRKEWNEYFSVLETNAGSKIQEAINQVRTQFNDYTNDGERDLMEVETYLLTPLDQRADEIIETRAAQTAVATALASHSFDALIVFWQSVKLIEQISQLYAGRPGVWGTLRLLRRGMAMVVFAEIADLAAQAVTGAVAQKSLAMLGG
ncbi:MAG: DUF697 domain-containing protein, partial [Planctomycetaceae bacterium]|nr:DUF697 domain-containing protein [Planctomycetaceae bacterium]